MMGLPEVVNKITATNDVVDAPRAYHARVPMCRARKSSTTAAPFCNCLRELSKLVAIASCFTEEINTRCAVSVYVGPKHGHEGKKTLSINPALCCRAHVS